MSPNGLGWIIVDSLDTLMIMNLTDRLSTARKWVQRSLNYDQDQDVNTFETTIRMLGGFSLPTILHLSCLMFLLGGTTSISLRQWTWPTDFLVPTSPTPGYHMQVSICEQ